VIRPFQVGQTEHKAAIVYVDGLADKNMVSEHILKPAMSCHLQVGRTPLSPRACKEKLLYSSISVGEISEVLTIEECIQKMMSGSTCLFIDGIEEIVVLGTPGWEARSIDEPVTEAVVRGPREGFVETLRSNTALLRRQIKDPNLAMISFTLGTRSQKDSVLLYIKGLTDPDLVDEIKERMEQIQIDTVLESGYIEQLIEGNPMTPFPQLQSTERPDKVISALMEGRVAILLDGTPFALIAPVTFSMLLQSPEDYFDRWIIGSLIRLLRYISAFFALFLPSLYVALISYHQGLIPTKLMISIAGTREGVPFSSIIEALMMEMTLEILREAGVRLPKPVGQAVGIVGGLVIGQAAVEAGIVSPSMVIVVALTAISSFAMPQYVVGQAIRVLRFPMMLFAAFFGLYGVVMFFIIICAHLVKLQSFGVNYLNPFVPYHINDWKDLLVRFPLRMMKKRPAMLKTNNTNRLNVSSLIKKR